MGLPLIDIEVFSSKINYINDDERKAMYGDDRGHRTGGL